MNKYITLSNKLFKYLHQFDFIDKLIRIDKYKISEMENFLNKKETYSLVELGKWHQWALSVDNLEYKWITLLVMYGGFSISEIVRL